MKGIRWRCSAASRGLSTGASRFALSRCVRRRIAARPRLPQSSLEGYNLLELALITLQRMGTLRGFEPKTLADSKYRQLNP
jgi:hypothetical protein